MVKANVTIVSSKVSRLGSPRKSTERSLRGKPDSVVFKQIQADVKEIKQRLERNIDVTMG